MQEICRPILPSEARLHVGENKFSHVHKRTQCLTAHPVPLFSRFDSSLFILLQSFFCCLARTRKQSTLTTRSSRAAVTEEVDEGAVRIAARIDRAED